MIIEMIAGLPFIIPTTHPQHSLSLPPTSTPLYSLFCPQPPELQLVLIRISLSLVLGHDDDFPLLADGDRPLLLPVDDCINYDLQLMRLRRELPTLDREYRRASRARWYISLAFDRSLSFFTCFMFP
jgi:hypothetical protein